MITGVDHAIGRVMKELNKQGILSDTIIIFMGDNGYYKGSRGFAGKWSHFDESLRVPLIIFDPRTPDAQQGRVVSEMALNVDIEPTIVEYGGEPIPDLHQGRSLVASVKGNTPDDWRDHFFAEHLMDHEDLPKWEGIRGEKYVYAHYFEHDYEFLYDLEKDPKQLNNLANDPEYQQILEGLRERTGTLRERYESSDVQKTPEIVDGVKDGALQYDGQQYFSELGTVPALGRDADFSWSFWVNVKNNNPHSGVLLGNRKPKNGGPRQFIKFTHHSVQYFNGDDSQKLSHDLPREKWVHLALVKSGEQLTYFVDGEPVAKGSVKFDMPSLPLYAGGDPQANEMASATVDEVRLYDQGLSAEQVKQLTKHETLSVDPVEYGSMDQPLKNGSSN